MDTLLLNEEQLDDNTAYNSTPGWDSIGHMSMIAKVEDVFEVILDTEDIVNFSSYKKGAEILAKYGIEF